MRGLFEGIRVIEIGQYVAAPVAAELFAHGGADVVRIEPVTGDLTRRIDPLPHVDGLGKTGRQYASKARGKRAIPIDLRQIAGRTLARELMLSADVVVSNLKPGAAAAMGLDHESLRAEQPRLIYGEINGFGDVGPLANRPSFDLIAQSWMGLRMSVGGDSNGRLGPYEAYLCDYTAGLLLAFGISAALHHREVTGEGQRISTSLAQAGLFLHHRSASLFDSVDDWKREYAHSREMGKSIAEVQSLRARRVAPDSFYMTTYETKDGMIAVAAPGDHVSNLCSELGVAPPSARPDWTDATKRDEVAQALRNDLAEALAQISNKEAVARLASRGIPVGPVRFLEEMLVDEEAVEAGLLYDGEHPLLGRYRMPSAPVKASHSVYRARSEISEHGADTTLILAELGYSSEEIVGLVEAGVVSVCP